MKGRRRPVVDRYAELSPKQRVGGALMSLVLARSFGGFDVHGGVGAEALRPLTDLEVSDFLYAELVRELGSLAGVLNCDREGAMIAVEIDFESEAPGGDPDDLDTLVMCLQFRRVARVVDVLAYARYGIRARQLGLDDDSIGLPSGDLAALAGARRALDSVAIASDEPEHFKERLLYAVAAVVDRAIRLCLPVGASSRDRRVYANAMIRDRFLNLGLVVPSEPVID